MTDKDEEEGPAARRRREIQTLERKVGATEVIYSRGRPARITVPARRFIDRGEELFRYAPTVTGARLTHLAPELIPDLVACPHLARLTRLYLGENAIGTEGVRAIVSSKHLSGLTHLGLGWNRVGTVGAFALASSEYLVRLTRLDLLDNGIDSVGALAIARCAHLSRLTHLDLSLNRIGPAGAHAIAKSKYMRNLTHLSLSLNRIGPGGAWAIARSEQLTNLTHLDLRGAGLGEQEYAVIRRELLSRRDAIPGMPGGTQAGDLGCAADESRREEHEQASATPEDRRSTPEP